MPAERGLAPETGARERMQWLAAKLQQCERGKLRLEAYIAECDLICFAAGWLRTKKSRQENRFAFAVIERPQAGKESHCIFVFQA